MVTSVYKLEVTSVCQPPRSGSGSLVAITEAWLAESGLEDGVDPFWAGHTV